MRFTGRLGFPVRRVIIGDHSEQHPHSHLEQGGANNQQVSSIATRLNMSLGTKRYHCRKYSTMHNSAGMKKKYG